MAKRDPDYAVRLERFRNYCRRRGWQSADGSWKSSEIGVIVEKPARQVRDILIGTASFGGVIAREFEGKLGLPRYYFDGLASVPFTQDLVAHLEGMSVEDAARCENVIRAHLGMPSLPSTEKKPNGTAGPIQRAA